MGENFKSPESIRYNKDMWTLITGSFVSSAEDAVSYELDKAERQLHLGINVFQRSDANKPANERLKTTETEDMCQFLDRLVVLLDVDMVVAYDLLGYYVLYEFRGSTEGMRDMINEERNKNMLIQDIWLFYRSERMFLLKCVNFLWTYFYDSTHQFHELYTDVLRRHSEADTFQALAKQMISAMDEQIPTVATHGRCMTERFQAAWFISNMREQIQTIHNMIIYLEFYNCTAKEFQQLYSICKGHSFGFSYDPPPSMHSEFVYFREIIGQMESILLLTALDLNTTSLEGSKLFTDGTIFRVMVTQMETLGALEAHGPLILAWMALMFHPDQTFVEPLPDFFEKYGGRMVQLRVFPYLTNLLKSSTVQNTSKLKMVAFDCVEKLLCSLLNSFAVESLVLMKGLFELTAMLLTNSTVTGHVWDSDRTSGLWLIIDEAKRVFPKIFLPLAGIVESVASCGPEFIESLTYDLENLCTYMESSNMSELSKFEETMDSVDSFLLTSSRHPGDGNLNVTFAAGTRGRFQASGEPNIQWEYELNFFVALNKQLSDLLAEISRGSSYVTEESYSRALGGIKCLHQLVENQCVITNEVSEAVAIVFNLIDKFAVGSQCPNEILASCLDVACAMLITRPEVVCRRLTSTKFLPAVDVSRCTDPTVIARGDFFHMRTVGYILTKHECTTGKYPLLLAYLRFVIRVIEPCEGDNLMTTLENFIEIILPCLVFVTTTIFPNYDMWPYENPDSDRTIIAHHCLRLMHIILSPDSSSELAVVIDSLKDLPLLKDGVKQIAPYLLHHSALYSLLHTDTSVGLIKVIGVGDRFLQELMERQPDWMEGSGVLFTNNVILAMSILNRVLLYKNTFSDDTDMSKIELLLLGVPPVKPRSRFTRPVTKRFPSSPTTSGTVSKHKPKQTAVANTEPETMVHIIANYIFHSFNPKLPIMAVRLLKRFALEFSISLLSCLAPDSEQICQHFLFRLNSLRESSDLKVAILELMTAGIARQPGLSETFLNFNGQSKEEYSSLDYIIATLNRLQLAPETVAVSIHQNVISLIHALWTLYCQRVLDHIRCREGFWDGVCAPFFLLPLSKEISLYYKIIEICTLEMKWFGPKMAPSLARNLKLFFDSVFGRWTDFIADTFVGKNDVGVIASDVEELALSWKNFLTVLVNCCPFTLEVAQKKMIVSSTMKILITELEAGDNQTIIRHIADTMLILITNWKMDCLEELSAVTSSHLQMLLELLSSSYRTLKSDSKESLLGFTLRLTSLLTEQISADDNLSSSVMQKAVNIASTEMTLILNSPPPVGNDRQVYSCLPATLSVSLVQKMINTIGNTSFWHANLSERKLVHQLMDVTQMSLEKPTLFSLAMVSLDTLLLLSYTDFAKTMILFKVGSKLWMPLIPPVDTMANGLPWFMGKWSQIYERALRLITHLLADHQQNFLAEAISFVGIHEPYIIGLLLGIRLCVKPELLRLAIATLNFLATLQQFREWKAEHPSSFYNINRCVVSTLDRCIAFLLQPKVLHAAVECTAPFVRKHYGSTPCWATSAVMSGEITDLPSSPAFAAVLSRLLECINACLSALYPLSPTFLSVMTDILETEVPIVPLVETDYEIPAVEQDPQGRLSLGTFLSLINLCTQAIAQKGNETPLGLSPTKALQIEDKYLADLPMNQLMYALEMSLSFMLAQTLVAASNTRLSQTDRKKIMVGFVIAMAPQVDNIKRFVLGEEVDRQLTPIVEKSLGSAGGTLKRLSNGGRSQCSRRLQFALSPSPKLAIIDLDPVALPPDPTETKSLVFKVAPKSQGLETAAAKHTAREYIQLMMILYQSSFQSAYR